jgi:hypothetical protein
MIGPNPVEGPATLSLCGQTKFVMLTARPIILLLIFWSLNFSHSCINLKLSMLLESTLYKTLSHDFLSNILRNSNYLL